jgi:hypothetical protein
MDFKFAIFLKGGKTMNLKWFIKAWVTFLFLIFLWSPSMAVDRTTGPGPGSQFNEITHKAEALKILSVLEERTGDQRLLERAWEKLLTLSDKEIRLIGSLCERISSDGQTAGGDIAFLLVTALIVLS